MRWMLFVAGALLSLSAGAQGPSDENRPNAILLVAKPELADPSFRQAVVLVTQAPDSSTVGVILNRPTERRHAKSGKSLGFGGPVMPWATVALFRSAKKPEAPAFHVLKGVYLTMHQANLEALFARPAEGYRLYSGFSGWAPRQLESEMVRDSWYVLSASESIVFREDMRGLWRELVEKARKMNAPRAQARCKESFAILSACLSSAIS
ncbi:MAG: YqgE/AlgH family protein [Betaproteobacteria bacterium]